MGFNFKLKVFRVLEKYCSNCCAALFKLSGIIFPINCEEVESSSNMEISAKIYSRQVIRTFLWATVSLSLLVLLGGCASTAEGITRALIDNGNEPAPRACTISGAPFEGIVSTADNADDGSANATVRLLLVHGIGTHQPGWSVPLQSRIAASKGLNSLDRGVKRIDIEADNFPGETLGHLIVGRFFDRTSGAELITYELTWSEITAPWKQGLSFDTTGFYRENRAEFNQNLKVFLNDRLLDPVAYLGRSNERIRAAAVEALCFSVMPDWRKLPDSGQAGCKLEAGVDLEEFRSDELVFITHSLGSRILVDALQTETAEVREQLVDESRPLEQRASFEEFLSALQDKEVRLYMMANQLPLIDAALPPPRIVNQIPAYCDQAGENYSQRIFDRLTVVAFSDPNDPLSYALPFDYANTSMDSRLCPAVVNVSVNVTDVVNPLGLFEFAPPLEAHAGYEQDPIVLGIMADGVGTDAMDKSVRDACTWVNIE